MFKCKTQCINCRNSAKFNIFFSMNILYFPVNLFSVLNHRSKSNTSIQWSCMGILGYRFRGEICWSSETDACQSERIRPEFTAFTRCPNHESVCLRPSVTGWRSKHISLCDQTKTPRWRLQAKVFQLFRGKKKFDQVKEKRVLFRKTIFVRHSNLSREFYAK